MPGDRTVAALTHLATAMEQTIADLQQLTERAHVLRVRVESGVPLTESMAAEERPLIITKLVEITDRLHETGGEVRRAEAHQLRAEGRTHEEIAAIFGVTRQRAAALLKSPEPKKPSKRPQPRPASP